ncbi:copper chaperone PCu(A)C [Sphingomonas sp.]|uniref:copper chaperone PCu(A)C n=1 Tax=Sphingomonas sp. TaxID=28214 RepID=UPI002DD6739D|nr:copper chaperone PCu(A)C [Sphingomonas sp.]
MRLVMMGAMAAVLLAGCGQRAEPQVEGAWVRLPAVEGRPAAAYFTLKAGGAPVTLLSVRTPAAVRTELHESMKGHGGMMTMKPLKQIDVAAGATLAFEPGAKHVMLFDVNPALKPGGEMVLTLAFADGKTVEAKAALRGAGDAGAGGHGAGH